MYTVNLHKIGVITDRYREAYQAKLCKKTIQNSDGYLLSKISPKAPTCGKKIQQTTSSNHPGEHLLLSHPNYLSKLVSSLKGAAMNA